MDMDEIKNLTVKDKNKIRKRIIKLIENHYTENDKCQIEKTLLESLLFDDVAYKEEREVNGNKKPEYIGVRIPVWFGSFLRKIDLSEVDFTNVSWDVYDKNQVGYYDNRYYAYTLVNTDKIYGKKKPFIDYSYTNANIDLTKSYEAINHKNIILMGCNFEGVNLSKYDIDSAKLNGLSVIYSNINNTNLNIKETPLYGEKSSFKNVDLSNYTIDGNKYFYSRLKRDSIVWGLSEYLTGCDLTDTHIHINFDYGNFQNVYKAASFSEKRYLNKKLIDTIKTYWVGCIVNYKEVKSNDMQVNKLSKKNSKALTKNIINNFHNGVKNR